MKRFNPTAFTTIAVGIILPSTFNRGGVNVLGVPVHAAHPSIGKAAPRPRDKKVKAVRSQSPSIRKRTNVPSLLVFSSSPPTSISTVSESPLLKEQKTSNPPDDSLTDVPSSLPSLTKWLSSPPTRMPLIKKSITTNSPSANGDTDEKAKEPTAVSFSPSITKIIPTDRPTLRPSSSPPSEKPHTITPTGYPQEFPSVTPSLTSTILLTERPSNDPTRSPKKKGSDDEQNSPSIIESATALPTATITKLPPMHSPTREPSKLPPSVQPFFRVISSHQPSVNGFEAEITTDVQNSDASNLNSTNATKTSYLTPSLIPAEFESCYNSSAVILGQRTRYPIILLYVYRMRYSVKFDPRVSLIPIVEQTIMQGLVSSSNIIGCDEEKSQILFRTEYGIVGVGRGAPDSLLTKACTREANKSIIALGFEEGDGKLCNYIEGRLSLYMHNESSPGLYDKAVNQTLHVIKQGMNAGVFAQAHEGIIELTFDEETANDRHSKNKDYGVDIPTVVKSKKADKIVPTWYLVGSGAVLICLTIFLTSRRKSNDGLSYGELVCDSEIGSTFNDDSIQ